MKRRGSRENEHILAGLRDLYELRDREGFIERVLSLLQTFIRCDYASYNEVNLRTGEARLRWNPPELESLQAAMQPVFQRYVTQHPMVTYVRTTGDQRAVKISDFLSDRNFEKLELYQEYYRRMGVRRQIGLSLDVSPTAFTPIVFNRSGRDFSKRDRTLLDALAPHLMQAFRNAEAVSRMCATIGTLQQIVEETDRGVLEIDGKGKILWGTPKAFLWLQAYWPQPRLSDLLPESLAAWVRHQVQVLDKPTAFSFPDPLTPLVLARESYRLSIRMGQDGDRRLLLMQEELDGVPPGKLEPLGLGRREAEVLSWVAQGKTNEEIGTLLSISPRTVKKHLERFFRSSA